MQRTQIPWFGKPPDDAQATLVEEHGFNLVVHGRTSSPDFRYACAALFWATDGYFSQAAPSLRDHLKAALNDGVYLASIVSPAADFTCLQDVKDLFSEADPTEAVKPHRVLTEPVELHKLLHHVLLHTPGAARDIALKITGDVEVDKESRFLLQRAFHDCRAIKLESITPGHSKAETFIVRATLKDSFAGPEPRPFFTKLGISTKLQKEMLAFRQYAEHHVPWYLRPNFIPERIAYGVENGILVGNFVPNSCSLAEAVRKGDGAQHVRSLFEETLAGLRQQFQTTAVASQERSVISALKEFCKLEKAPATRWETAKQLFGGDMVDPQALWWRLVDLPRREWRKSAIHGDLHGENVRVRKDDAILIDFAHACTGPASADLAQLEVSLAFDTMEGDEQGEEWRAIVMNLYSAEAIRASLQPQAVAVSGTWIHEVVAEIRSLACASVTGEDEYMRVLAVYLLRQGCLPESKKLTAQNEYRRTFAYWLACRLTEHLDMATSVQTLSA